MPMRAVVLILLAVAVTASHGACIAGDTAAAACPDRLDRRLLEQSLDLGTRFILGSQLPAGNFTYAYDWITRTAAAGDSSARQAGAAWGLSLVHGFRPSQASAAAVEKALAFFKARSRLTPGGARYIVYPGEATGSTGAVALTALAHIEYLRAEAERLEAHRAAALRADLGGYLSFLLAARTADGLWHSRYRIENGLPFGEPSPYADGEALLALVKAARHLQWPGLWEVILASADAGYLCNVEAALSLIPDSRVTKGYYQWGSMAFFEIAADGSPDRSKYGDYVLRLADWMIDVHRTLERPGNTAYAYEGILHAFELARRRGLDAQAARYRCVIAAGLAKLCGWQVGGPLANAFIRRGPPPEPRAVGGIQNRADDPLLRIDVTQHQMHALVLALKYAYPR